MTARSKEKFDDLCSLCNDRSSQLSQVTLQQLAQLEKLEKAAESLVSRLRASDSLSASTGELLLAQRPVAADLPIAKITLVDFSQTRVSLPRSPPPAINYYTLPRPVSSSRRPRPSRSPASVLHVVPEVIRLDPSRHGEHEPSLDAFHLPMLRGDAPTLPAGKPKPHLSSQAPPPSPPSESPSPRSIPSPLSRNTPSSPPALPPSKPTVEKPHSSAASPSDSPEPKPEGEGLASRQAMLSAMMVGSGKKSEVAAPPKEALPAPKKLEKGAAVELAKKLLSASQDLSKYQHMKKAGLHQGAIEHAMRKDGVDPAVLFSEDVETPVETKPTPPILPSSVKPVPPALPAAPKPSPPSSIGFLKRRLDKKEEGEHQSSTGGSLASRQAMLAAMMGGGGGKEAVVPVKDDLQPPKKLDTSAAELLSKKLGAGASSKDVSKYERMLKAGLPQGAVEQAMNKDGVDPNLLYAGGATAATKPAPSDKPIIPPPPLPAVVKPATPKQYDEPRPKSLGGGLASRQAMLAAMMGGGGKVAATATKNDDVPAPQKLNASAADEFSKKFGSSATAKDLSKYEKMIKAGLPQGAVQQAMRKDGLDPKLMFN